MPKSQSSAAPQPLAVSRPRRSPEEDAYIELLRTTEMLSRRPAQILKNEDLSSNQYNVLRILRGSAQSSESGGLPCGEIANRMITRDPDITRLLDRLEKRALIARWRDKNDRRVVLARITSQGLALLARLDGPIQDAHRRQLGHLGPARLKALTALLEETRART